MSAERQNDVGQIQRVILGDDTNDRERLAVQLQRLIYRVRLAAICQNL